MRCGTLINVTIWGQKIIGQGHDGIKYAGNSTFWACQHVVLKSISPIFIYLPPMMCYGTQMNALYFRVKRSQFKSHGGIAYAGTVTAYAEACSVQRLMSS